MTVQGEEVRMATPIEEFEAEFQGAFLAARPDEFVDIAALARSHGVPLAAAKDAAGRVLADLILVQRDYPAEIEALRLEAREILASA